MKGTQGGTLTAWTSRSVIRGNTLAGIIGADRSRGDRGLGRRRLSSPDASPADGIEGQMLRRRSSHIDGPGRAMMGGAPPSESEWEEQDQSRVDPLAPWGRSVGRGAARAGATAVGGWDCRALGQGLAELYAPLCWDTQAGDFGLIAVREAATADTQYGLSAASVSETTGGRWPGHPAVGSFRQGLEGMISTGWDVST